MLDLSRARAGADLGIARVATSAEAANAGWMDQALDLIRLFAARSQNFMAEEVRAWAEESGLPSPPDKRAWGAVFRLARRHSIIEMVGYGVQRSANCHGSPKSIWRGTGLKRAA